MENSKATLTDEESNISYLYPLFGVVGAVIALILFLRIYTRLTLGMCNCTTDMRGKTVIVTGANTGIGLQTAKELARRGARVVLACRNRERGQRALEEIVRETGNQEIVLKDLDLCSFASVRAFAEDFSKNESALHVLINNAGHSGTGKREVTEDGCEKTMQSNHLGHFLLTLLLLDILKKSAPSRIINVSSVAHAMVRLPLDDLNYTNGRYNFMVAYAYSKLANVLFTRELSKRLQGTGVTANCLHPGLVNSEFLRPELNVVLRVYVKMIYRITGRSSFEGAQTSIHLALSPELGNVSGRYFSDCKLAKESKWSRNDERAAKLWEVSENLVDLKP